MQKMVKGQLIQNKCKQMDKEFKAKNLDVVVKNKIAASFFCTFQNGSKLLN